MTEKIDEKEIIGVVSKQKDYTVEVKYSPKAIAKKLMRFTTPSGDQFEISAEEMISMLVGQVNAEVLSPTFVESERINVVQVKRQITAKLVEDMPAGTTIPISYTHPYPLEFALIEEAYKIAEIQGDKSVVLTKEFIDDVKSRLQPGMENFVKKFYKSFKKLNLDNKKINK